MKISLDLTPKQERYLIRLGLETLAGQAVGKQPRIETRTNGHKWTPGQRKKFIASMSKRWDAKKRVSADVAKPVKKHAKKKATKNAHPWTPERRRRYAATLAKQGKKLDKLAAPVTKKAKTKTNGHALHTRTMLPENIPLRRDGKPLKEPRKQWTPEHRANFIASMKKRNAEKLAMSLGAGN